MIYKILSIGFGVLSIFLLCVGLAALYQHEYLRSIASGILSVACQMFMRSVDKEYERNHSIKVGNING